MPLAGILGRLCHHPCEQGCRRGNWDDPAAIRDMERVVSDHDCKSATPYTPLCNPASGKSVVIVGAGPTGLTAAFYLARNGHRVTVCDRASEAGGSLREVPEQTLPASVRADEIAALTRMGIEFKLGVELGREVTAEGLTRGFDAILLTVGEKDYRVPLNNTLEFWLALQRQAVPSRLVVFPEENHWVLKGENSRYHYQVIQDWLAEHLK